MIQRMEPIWREMGHKLISSYKGADVQLSLVKIHNRGKVPIVLRLDGVYYDLDVDYRGIDYRGRNEEISKAHSIADAVIYQSKYGKELCETYLTPRKKKALYRIIPNGIEKNWVTRKPHDGMNIVVAAIWRRHKRLREIIEIFLELLVSYQDVKLHVIGALEDNKEIPHPNIFYYGEISHSRMREIYETADLHVHLSKRDNCPNTVIEAIGAGVPVLTTNLCGGATEICFQYDGGYVYYEGEDTYTPVYLYRDEWNKLPDDTKEGLINGLKRFYSGKVKTTFPEQIDIRNVAKKYIEVMEETCGK